MSGANTRGPLRGKFDKHFRGKSNNGRGKSRGMKDTRKYLKGKEGKTEEIRRALTHRANLRKNYFKLLKKEGLDDRMDKDKVFDDESQSLDDHSGADFDSTKTDDPSHRSRTSDDEEDEIVGETSATNYDHKVEPNNRELTEIEKIKQKVSNHEPLTFQERILLKKDRRMKDKERKLQKTREKLDYLKQQNNQRKLQTNRVKQAKTRKGQILMAPRIESLLEKIKQEKGV